MDNQTNVADAIRAAKIARAIELLSSYLNIHPEKLAQFKTAFPHYENTESLVSDIVHQIEKKCTLAAQTNQAYTFDPEKITSLIDTASITKYKLKSSNALSEERCDNADDFNNPIKRLPVNEHSSNFTGEDSGTNRLNENTLPPLLKALGSNTDVNAIDLHKLLSSLDAPTLSKLLNLVIHHSDNQPNAKKDDHALLAETVARQSAVIERQNQQIDQLTRDKARVEKELNDLKIQQLLEVIDRLKVQSPVVPQPKNPNTDFFGNRR